MSSVCTFHLLFPSPSLYSFFFLSPRLLFSSLYPVPTPLSSLLLPSRSLPSFFLLASVFYAFPIPPLSPARGSEERCKGRAPATIAFLTSFTTENTSANIGFSNPILTHVYYNLPKVQQPVQNSLPVWKGAKVD